MKVLFYELVSESKARITSQHSRPDLLSEEDKKSSIEIDIVPEPDDNGKIADLYCNPTTGELFYEYKERVYNVDDVETLKIQNADLNIQLIDLWETLLGAGVI